jgi:hypothetical protein
MAAMVIYFLIWRNKAKHYDICDSYCNRDTARRGVVMVKVWRSDFLPRLSLPGSTQQTTNVGLLFTVRIPKARRWQEEFKA